MNQYSGDGAFWWATKNKCSNLKRPHRKLKARIKSCKKKGFPIGYKTSGSEYSFTVTDERLEEMAEDGTLERLQTTGTQVHGGGDPIYFDWKNKVGQIRKQLPTRSLQQYKQMYPYLGLDIWSQMSATAGAYNWGKDHEATLKFYREYPDVEYLKTIKYKLENPAGGLTFREEMIGRIVEETINVGWEYAIGKIPVVGKILSYTKDQLDEVEERAKMMAIEEKKVLDERIKSSIFIPPIMPLPSTTPSNNTSTTPSNNTTTIRTKINKSKDDAAATTLGISGIILIAVSLL